MKIGLVTDSASDLPFDFADEHNIKITPMNVNFDETNHKEDRNFDFDNYYRQFEERKLFRVKTSQPSPGDFLEQFMALKDEGVDFIICATVSSGLSGTYNSAIQASRALEEEHGLKAEVVDAKSASVSVVYLLELALEMISAGAEPEAIVTAMRERVDKIETYLTLPTLKYLRAGGRVSMPKFLIGSLFGLKPITYVEPETGKNEAIATVKNMDAGVEKVYNLMTSEGTKLPKHFSITHTNDEELANKMANLIRKNQPEVEIRITRARSSISAHAGPGALALIALFD
ncbi:MAG: DegV family protein [Candidatus Kariarchaeaceae archaeon]|jgi:DegV family protein with EDD domain